jgi:hypothetical protein
MKVKLTEKLLAGASRREVVLEKVIELDDKEKLPAGAVKVPDDTEAHDWKEVNN